MSWCRSCLVWYRLPESMKPGGFWQGLLELDIVCTDLTGCLLRRSPIKPSEDSYLDCPLQDGGFIAEIAGGLRTDAGGVQLQLMLGAAIVSTWPPAQSAGVAERAHACSAMEPAAGAWL